MARKFTGQKPGTKNSIDEDPPLAPTPRLALSIPAFCEAHDISEDFFYKLKRQGQTPRLMKVGARTLVSLEAAADWRREREVATAIEAAARAAAGAGASTAKPVAPPVFEPPAHRQTDQQPSGLEAYRRLFRPEGRRKGRGATRSP
jgi:hypothetical protein